MKFFLIIRSFSAALALADDEVLSLAVRFHVTQGATMTVKKQKKEMWVKQLAGRFLISQRVV